jgi:hypothetical protein
MRGKATSAQALALVLGLPQLRKRPLNSARFLGQMSCLVDHAAAVA